MSDDEALTPLQQGELVGPARVDRDSSLRLEGDAAASVRDALGRATREGMKLSRSARPGDVFELVPPKELAQGIKDGTLRAAKPGSGDASVLVKNVKDGRIAGKADLQRLKPTPAELIGPAAWQALALASQQHYLAEISAKLDGIQHGVDELRARLDDDRIGTLNDLSELAATAEVAARRDGRLPDARLSDVRAGARRAKELWHQIATTSRRQLEQYRDGDTSAEEVEKTFALLAYATRVLTQCSETLLAVPYATAGHLEDAVAEEQDRLYPVMPQFLVLCQELLSASDDWMAHQTEYDSRRPKNRVARALRVPAVDVRRDKGKMSFELHVRPKQRPLGSTEQATLRLLASGGGDAPPVLVAEVDAEGAVLLGPAAAD